MAEITIDIMDYLSEMTVDELMSEIDDRMKDNIQRWTNIGLASDLRLAFYGHDASRFELLLKHIAP